MEISKMVSALSLVTIMAFGLETAQAAVITSNEDDGSITLANDAGLGGTFSLKGSIGDGPYGSTSGDSDFFKFKNIAAGAHFSAAIFSNLDPVIGLYNASGTLLTSNDDGNKAGGSTRNQDSFINNFVITTAGDYYLAIRSYINNSAFGFQQSAFDSASGYALTGTTTTGNYTATVTITPATVPVPAALPLFAAGLSGLALGMRRKKTV